jgi:hypothetical protein
VSCIRSRSHTAALSNRPISNRWTGCSGCIDQRPASLARTRPVTSPMRTPVRSERGCIAGDRAARATDGVPHATAKRLEQVPRRSRTGYDIDRGDRDGPALKMGQSSWLPKIALSRTVSPYHVTGGRNYRLKLAGRRNSPKLPQIPAVILGVIAQN